MLYNYRLKPLDVEFMKALHNRVNIVPVIAKADTLTIAEVKRLKKRILDEIHGHGIQIYQLPDADDDEDEEFKEQTRLLRVRNDCFAHKGLWKSLVCFYSLNLVFCYHVNLSFLYTHNII